MLFLCKFPESQREGVREGDAPKSVVSSQRGPQLPSGLRLKRFGGPARWAFDPRKAPDRPIRAGNEPAKLGKSGQARRHHLSLRPCLRDDSRWAAGLRAGRTITVGRRSMLQACGGRCCRWTNGQLARVNQGRRRWTARRAQWRRPRKLERTCLAPICAPITLALRRRRFSSRLTRRARRP